MSAQPPADDGFQALRQSGVPAGPSRSIGSAVAVARDAVAHWLVRCGATPDRITLLGFALTVAAGYCLACGASHAVPYFNFYGRTASWWPILTLALLFLAGACDMLDGAVARIGRLRTRAGGILDSTVDRLSDMAIYVGCFLHFALLPQPNLTYQVLAVIALGNGVLISYIKARAENVIADCSVGYWLRGERIAGVMIACAVGHVPAVLWQMAISGSFTAWRRIQYAYGLLRAIDAGRPLPPRGPSARWYGIFQVWRHPRGSVGYDLTTGLHIAFVVFAPLLVPALRVTGQYADPLRLWLGS